MAVQSEAVAHNELVGGSQTSLHSHSGGGGEAFPVGSVFIAVVNTNPNTLLGYGTWSQIAQGKMLVGQDDSDADFDTPEETGGAKTHTHDSHTSVSNARTGGSLTVLTGPETHSADGLPPYFVIYAWKRTA